MPPDLHVLVVAYGNADDLAVCLAGLAGCAPVTVVDNSSSPECRTVVERVDGRYIDPGRNLGFASGVNAGLEAIGHPMPDVLLLNPDAVIQPEAVAALHHRLRASSMTAAASPALVGMDGMPQRVCWPFPSPARMWLEAVGLGRLGARSGFLVGAILLLRGEAIAEVGSFDERFFLYAEETDWQRRAIEAGWDVLYCPEVVGTHRGAGTSTDPVLREARFHCGAETFIRKWHGNRGWHIYRGAALAGALLRCARLDSMQRLEARRRVELYVRGPCRSLGALRTS